MMPISLFLQFFLLDVFPYRNYAIQIYEGRYYQKMPHVLLYLKKSRQTKYRNAINTEPGSVYV